MDVGTMLQEFSSLSESGFIPTPEGTCEFKEYFSKFSSLSESGFIPTWPSIQSTMYGQLKVLISFREWLHSYDDHVYTTKLTLDVGSHLFQRVASFLQVVARQCEYSYLELFSSLSESGFIPTK